MLKTYPLLYSFRRCPYAMRARLALYHLKISHEHREVDLKNKPVEMIAISPKGTVPVLQLTDGRILEESLDIMRWAFKAPPFKGSPLSQREDQLITENDTLFKHALDRYKYPGRYAEEGTTDYRDECTKFLQKVESQLRPFLTGDVLALTDMALFPFIRQFSLVDSEWFDQQDYPHIHKWLNFFHESNLFIDVMKKYKPWSQEKSPLLVIF